MKITLIVGKGDGAELEVPDSKGGTLLYEQYLFPARVRWWHLKKSKVVHMYLYCVHGDEGIAHLVGDKEMYRR